MNEKGKIKRRKGREKRDGSINLQSKVIIPSSVTSKPKKKKSWIMTYLVPLEEPLEIWPVVWVEGLLQLAPDSDQFRGLINLPRPYQHRGLQLLSWWGGRRRRKRLDLWWMFRYLQSIYIYIHI